MREDGGTEQRRPYRSPRLKVYGDARSLTGSSGGNSGKNDKGGGNDKTSFT